jgi:hypothetical protein
MPPQNFPLNLGIIHEVSGVFHTYQYTNFSLVCFIGSFPWFINTIPLFYINLTGIMVTKRLNGFALMRGLSHKH